MQIQLQHALVDARVVDYPCVMMKLWGHTVLHLSNKLHSLFLLVVLVLRLRLALVLGGK